MNSLKNFHFKQGYSGTKEMSFISQNLSFSHEQVATIEEIRKILQIDKVIATSFLMQKYSLIAKTSMFQWILHHNASEINFIYSKYFITNPYEQMFKENHQNPSYSYGKSKSNACLLIDEDEGGKKNCSEHFL